MVSGSAVESWAAGQQIQMWMERGCLMHLTVAYAVVAFVVAVACAVVVSAVVASAVVAGFVVADVARCLVNAVNAVLIAAMVAVFVHLC